MEGWAYLGIPWAYLSFTRCTRLGCCKDRGLELPGIPGIPFYYKGGFLGNRANERRRVYVYIGSRCAQVCPGMPGKAEEATILGVLVMGIPQREVYPHPGDGCLSWG